MSITVHQRPGVYSSYDASTVVSGRGTGKLVGLAAVNMAAAAGTVQTVTSYDRAVALFGSGGGIFLLCPAQNGKNGGQSGCARASVPPQRQRYRSGC